MTACPWPFQICSADFLIPSAVFDPAAIFQIFYVYMVREAPYQLQEACVIHGNPYEKGWWVFAMTWFYKLPDKQIYYLGSNPVDKLLFNLNAVVTGIGNVRFTRKTVADVGPTTYELSEAEHLRILNDGNLGS
jgi:hypothetical protein